MPTPDPKSPPVRVADPAETTGGSALRTGSHHGPATTTDHPADDESVPAAVGRFEVRAVLGAGAFGRVYRAFDPNLGREVAVKVPLARALRTDADRDRFLREARAAATISHPNVCQIHEVGEHDGRPYIVMALVPGQSLAEVLRGRTEPLPERQAAVITRKLALALAAAHDRGVVHRDLKPANVMFDRERKDLVVMDFGLARGPRLPEATATQSGVIMGTPAYMSPEQARGDSKAVGPAGDIYSLGVIMYELLAGCRPFAGTTAEVIGQILHVEPMPPSARRPGIDPRLEDACLKAMTKDPAARFASMKEFAAALDPYLRTPSGPAGETVRATETRKDRDDALSTDTRKLAEVLAAADADRRAETAAAVEDAVARSRTPRWVFVALALLFVGAVAAVAGVVFFAKTDNAKVTIELTGIDLADKSLSFTLDGKAITADELSKPIELKAGDHELVVSRAAVVVKRYVVVVAAGAKPKVEYREVDDPAPKDPKLPADEAGFAALFNGKDLTGWETDAKSSHFGVDPDGYLTAYGDTAMGPMQWLLTKKEYADYVLRFEVQFVKPLPTHTNTGVAIRAALGKTGAGGAKLEVQLRDGADGPLRNGAVVYTLNDAVEPKNPVSLAPGQWHKVEIEARGPLVKVTMNGTVVNEADLTKIDRTLLARTEKWAEAELDRKKGRIGLQSWKSPAKFRNIRVKELAGP